MSKNIDTMLRFVEAQNNHDSAAVTACFAPDFKRRSAETQWQEMGVGNYADMSDRYWAAFPDTHFEIQYLMEDGDFVFVPGIRAAISSGEEKIPAKAITKDGKVNDIDLWVKGLTEDEKEIILEGCLMNYYAAQNK